MILYKHRVYCETESAHVFKWTETMDLLEVCPNNPGHTVTLSSGVIVETDGSSIVCTTPSNEFATQMVAVTGTAEAGEPVVIDYEVQNFAGEEYTSKWLWGGVCFTDGGVKGDWAEFQVVLPGDPDVVVKTYVIKVYIDPTESLKISSLAPGEIPVGLLLRCVYHSTGAEDVKVFINYDLNTKDA